MSIEGQGNSRLDDRGFTMVVLLVVIAVLGVGMTAMLPTWRQQAIREKEEELIFRGNQYARALVLYSRKNNNLLPTSVDLLYDGKYLRKKWKDPITGEDFGLLPVGQPAGAQGATPGTGSTPGAPQGGRGATPAPQGGRGATPPGGRGTGPGSSFGQQVIGQIQGVYSTSTDTSIRVYQNQQRYIDWQFTVQTAQLLMGQGRAGGAGIPARGGGPGDGRGGTGPGTGIGGPGAGRGGPGGGRGGQPAGGPGRGIQPGQTPGRGGQAPPVVPGRGGRGGG